MVHKRQANEFTLNFAVRPTGPLLIKSGQESGADPTLLDMNFVRTYYAPLGAGTVYLPGSSLKGTLRSYAEKIARTVAADDKRQPPFSCNPLGRGVNIEKTDYSCGAWIEKKKKDATSMEKHADSCLICRTFGNNVIASHVTITDAYPVDPEAPEDMALLLETNRTGERDGVAIDRVSGAVAVGPFNLEVVNRGAFFGSLTLFNFQLWQLGLLAIVLRDLSMERVPIGFAKSRGLGRVKVEFSEAKVAYPGRFSAGDAADSLKGITSLLSEEALAGYDYRPEKPLPLHGRGELLEEGEYGRVVLGWTGHDNVETLLKQCVPYWADMVANW